MSLIKVRRIATLDGEDRRNGKDSIADKEREYTRLYELAQKNITFHAAKGDSAKVAEWKRKADEYKRLAQEAENAAEARNTKDSAATDANFKKGDKVTVKTKWAGTRKGIVKEVINDPALKKAYVVEIEGTETYAYPAEIVSADACEDSSEPNNDANDSAAKFRIGQEVIVKTKYTEPYKARIVGLWDMSQNGPYNEQGYLIRNIKGGGVESMPEHALSLVTAKDSAELT